MLRRLVPLTLLTAFALFLGSADAGDDAKKAKGKGGKLDPEKAFQKLDANGDGKLSKDEFLKMLDKIPDQAKADKARQYMGKRFDALDTEQKGLTLDQFKKLRDGGFKKKKDAN